MLVEEDTSSSAQKGVKVNIILGTFEVLKVTHILKSLFKLAVFPLLDRSYLLSLKLGGFDKSEIFLAYLP